MENKNRLICAKDCEKFLREQIVKETGAFSKGINKGLRIALSAICNNQAIPTVSARDVVCCKDCDWGNGNLVCTNPKCGKSWYGCPVPPDHYCSYGERRENK